MTPVPVGKGQLTGTAGEYFVAAELSARGWLATVTIKNTPGIDVLAKHPASGQTAAIQVKTTSKPSGRFILGESDEQTTRAVDEWYVLVVLQSLGVRPRFFLVPRNVVAGYLYCAYREWRDNPARKHPGKDVPTRDIDAAHLANYEDAWHLLEQPTVNVPFLLDDWWVDRARLHPRPGTGYPGFPL